MIMKKSILNLKPTKMSRRIFLFVTLIGVVLSSCQKGEDLNVARYNSPHTIQGMGQSLTAFNNGMNSVHDIENATKSGFRNRVDRTSLNFKSTLSTNEVWYPYFSEIAGLLLEISDTAMLSEYPFFEPVENLDSVTNFINEFNVNSVADMNQEAETIIELYKKAARACESVYENKSYFNQYIYQLQTKINKVNDKLRILSEKLQTELSVNTARRDSIENTLLYLAAGTEKIELEAELVAIVNSITIDSILLKNDCSFLIAKANEFNQVINEVDTSLTTLIYNSKSGAIIFEKSADLIQVELLTSEVENWLLTNPFDESAVSLIQSFESLSRINSELLEYLRR